MASVSIDSSVTVAVLTPTAMTVAILLFAWYTLVTAPQTFVILVVTILLAWVVEGIWRAISKRQLKAEDM